MPELNELLALVVALYVLECLRWVGKSSLCLVSRFPGQWRVERPFEVAPQWKRALAFTAPWPPLGALHVVDGLLAFPGPKGVTVHVRGGWRWTRPGVTALHVPWKDVRRLRVAEQELLLDGEGVGLFPTARAARAWQGLLSEVEGGERPEKAVGRFLEARFDAAEAGARLQRWRRRGWPLVVCCNLLWLSLFGALGAWASTASLSRWAPALGALAGCWLLTAVVHELCLRRFLERDERPSFLRRLVSWLSPLTLIRGADDIRAELLGELDLAVVAPLRLRGRALEEALRTQLLALTWPLSSSHAMGEQAPPSPMLEDEAWLRSALLLRTVRALASAGIDSKKLLASQPQRDPSSQARCPRCGAQFVTLEARCEGCPGVPLAPWGEAQAGVASRGGASLP